MLKKIVLILLIGSALVNCAGLTPQQAGSIGAISGTTAAKIQQDLKEVAELKPYLNIPTIEVCYKTYVTGDKFNCTLTPCKENCSRVIDKIDYHKTVFIPESMWLKFSGEIKALCTSDLENFKDVCKFNFGSYKTTIGVFNDEK